MRTIRLTISTSLCLLLLCTVITSPSVALYHTGMGRYVQRDPHGTMLHPRHMFAGDESGAGNGFVPRDRAIPELMYPDGENIYAGHHVLHSGVDPSGMDSASVRRRNAQSRRDRIRERNRTRESNNRYGSIDEAINARYGIAIPRQRDENVEQCGMVCKDCETGEYYTTAGSGFESFCLPNLFGCKRGDEDVAMWHTHPFPYDYFSDVDEWWALQTDLPFYMGMPGADGGPWRTPGLHPST